MTRQSRLDKVEARLTPESDLVTFHLCHATCKAYWEMTPEDHEAWHRDHGHSVFTLNLGGATISVRPRPNALAAMLSPSLVRAYLISGSTQAVSRGRATVGEAVKRIATVEDAGG